MWVGAASGIGLSPATATSGGSYNAATNHNINEVYDAAGNQTTMGGIYSFSYDAENRQISETNSIGNPAAQYAYDGDGHRVQKTVGGNTTVYVYDALGQLAAEYTNAPAGTPPCQTCYLTYDHLGSTRMVTDENARVVSLHDYLPFGEEIPGNSVGRSGLFGSGTGKFATLAGTLRQAARGKGNFGLGTGTAENAEELGKAWVGEGATTASDGKTLVSANGTRVYRPPSYKPNVGKVQANFEQKLTPGSRPYANGHLDIQ